MSRSKSLSPGRNELLNGTTTHSTSSSVKPSSSATAYATALSKPSPVAGSLISQSEPSGEPPSNHGGNAGLSVPIVSLPSETSSRLSFAQSDAASVVVAAALVVPAASSSSSEPQPAATSERAST